MEVEHERFGYFCIGVAYGRLGGGWRAWTVRLVGWAGDRDNGAMEAMKRAGPEEEFPVEYVSIHGQRFSYRRGGEGPVLLLLHGIAGSSRTWIPAMRLLQRDFTVLAPDFLGHGQSAKPLGDYSLGNHASAMRD